MNININITKVCVIECKYRTDIINIHTELPTAHPEMKYPVTFQTEARKGYGVQWCREVLGFEPEVIDDV